MPSSEEGGRIPLTHLKRASRATPQCRMVLPNGMPALSITGVFSRDTWQWAVGPQLKKAVILLLLLTGTVLLSDGDVFSRRALSEAALLGQDSRYNDQNKAAAVFIFRPFSLPSSCPSFVLRSTD